MQCRPKPLVSQRRAGSGPLPLDRQPGVPKPRLHLRMQQSQNLLQFEVPNCRTAASSKCRSAFNTARQGSAVNMSTDKTKASIVKLGGPLLPAWVDVCTRGHTMISKTLFVMTLRSGSGTACQWIPLCANLQNCKRRATWLGGIKYGLEHPVSSNPADNAWTLNGMITCIHMTSNLEIESPLIIS